MSTRLVIGCGYLGLRVARRWREQGHAVHALTRSPERTEAWRREGLLPIVGDVTDRESLAGLPVAEQVLWAVGYDRRAGKPIDEVYVQGLRHLLDALPSETGRVISISSTGVYGGGAGDWVDERTECQPRRDGGRASLDGERCLQRHPLGARSVILRLAGIYGPGRIPRAEALQQGAPIDAPADGFLNLIHVDDAVSAVLLAGEVEPLPALYNVSDGQPPQRRDYYAELARLLGAPAPRFVAPSPDSPAAARAAADKRISNRRAVAELGLRLVYPSYREGLAAIVAER